MFTSNQRRSLRVGAWLRYRQSQAAFTLLEVTLALAILVLLAGGLFFMVQSTMQAAAELEQRQRHSQQVSGLMELCRNAFRTLPSGAVLEGRTVEENGVSLPEVVFRDAPQAFSWGESSVDYGTIILEARPQIGGLFTLSLFREDVSAPDSKTEMIQGRRVVLLNDLRKVQWRFYDPRSGGWSNEWHDPTAHPTLVELTLTMAGEPSPMQCIFWLPPLARSGA